MRDHGDENVAVPLLSDAAAMLLGMTTEQVRERAREVLGRFQWTRAQKRVLWEAFQENPEGVERIVNESLHNGVRVPQAVIWSKISEGAHRLEPPQRRERITGWRFVRGSHGGTYVEDPQGTDPLPPGYSFGNGGTNRGHDDLTDDGMPTLTYSEYLASIGQERKGPAWVSRDAEGQEESAAGPTPTEEPSPSASSTDFAGGTSESESTPSAKPSESV